MTVIWDVADQRWKRHRTLPPTLPAFLLTSSPPRFPAPLHLPSPLCLRLPISSHYPAVLFYFPDAGSRAFLLRIRISLMGRRHLGLIAHSNWVPLR